jgi:N-methylhydantoinase A
VDLRTIGAGGGTLLHVDASGLLKLGPASAGAEPGPACYGLGGTQPTVTDVHAVLGTLAAGNLLGGCIRVCADRARAALETVAERIGLDIEETATGALRILVNDLAIHARRVLNEHAVDPRAAALLAFGGAGPLHAALLAYTLRIPKIIVPRYPGLASAMGLILGRFRHLSLRSYPMLLAPHAASSIEQAFRQLEEDALREIGPELRGSAVKLRRQVELRYLRQGFELVIELPETGIDADAVARLRDRFAKQHNTRFGYGEASETMELVGLRLACEATGSETAPLRAAGPDNGSGSTAEWRMVMDPRSGQRQRTRVYQRGGLHAGDQLGGPAIVEQADATTWIPSGLEATVDQAGNLVIAIPAAERE